MMEFRQDCIYFISDRPCKFHKLDTKVVCKTCLHYKKFTTKILIIKLAAIGDVVRTTSILKPLFKKYKNPQICWVTNTESLPVLENNPYVKEKISYETSWQLTSEKFDVLINLDLDKEAIRLTKLISADEKIGFYLDENDRIVCSNIWAEEWFKLSHNDVSKKKNKITYQKYMIKIIGFESYRVKECPIIINLTEEEKNFAKKFAEQNNISKNDFVIGINTGGGDKWPKKEWPVENTVELINRLLKSEKLKVKDKIKILIFGGKKEKNRNEKIFESLKFKVKSLKVNKEFGKGRELSLNFNLLTKVIDTGTDNSLREFFALLNLCNVVVVTDSLALHVLLGLKKKVVVLFGPTSASEIETYGLGKKIVSKIDCIGCYNRDCKKSPYCMQLITPETVVHFINSII
ncbi:MAG: glycosyltransferase family 9 protein [Endomicrobiia bacterium]